MVPHPARTPAASLGTVEQTTLGSGCTTNSTLTVSATYTPPSMSVSVTVVVASVTITTNGMQGFLTNGSYPIAIKTSTNVSYSTHFAPGTCLTSPPTYTIYPLFEVFY